MWWFGREEGKKRRKNLKVPEFPRRPICCYVRRLEPETHNGVALSDKVGSFDYVEDHYDLIKKLGQVAGGGTFKVRVYDALNKRIYIGTDVFSICGQPLIDGEPIRPKEEEPPDILAMKEEIKRVEALTRLDEVKAKRRQAEQARRTDPKGHARPKRKPGRKFRRRRPGG